MISLQKAINSIPKTHPGENLFRFANKDGVRSIVVAKSLADKILKEHGCYGVLPGQYMLTVSDFVYGLVDEASKAASNK